MLIGSTIETCTTKVGVLPAQFFYEREDIRNNSSTNKIGQFFIISYLPFIQHELIAVHHFMYQVKWPHPRPLNR